LREKSQEAKLKHDQISLRESKKVPTHRNINQADVLGWKILFKERGDLIYTLLSLHERRFLSRYWLESRGLGQWAK